MADVDVAALRTQVGDEFPGLGADAINRIVTDRILKSNAYMVYRVQDDVDLGDLSGSARSVEDQLLVRAGQRWWPTNITAAPAEVVAEVVDFAEPQEPFEEGFEATWYLVAGQDPEAELPVTDVAEIDNAALVLVVSGEGSVTVSTGDLDGPVPATFDLTAKVVQLKLLGAPADLTGVGFYAAGIVYEDDHDDPTAILGMGIRTDGDEIRLYCEAYDFGTPVAEVAYDAEEHAYLRIEVVDGTASYQVSSDGVAFTEVFDGEVPEDLSAMTCRLYVQCTLDEETGPASVHASFSSLNTAP